MHIGQTKGATGFLILSQNTLLLSGWRTQPVVCLSSAEAEVTAITAAFSEGLLFRSLLPEVGIECKLLRVYSDSTAAGACRRGVGRIMHLDFKHLWLQEHHREGDIVFDHVARS